jgi:HK97 family phage portal protein
MPGLPLRDPVLVKYFGGGPTASGVPVTEWTALNFSSWWGAVQIISNAVAALPLFLYRRLPNGGKERFTGHPLYRILHDEFNAQMTSVKARQTMQAHVLTWGNAYAEIVFNGGNQVAELRPITPDRVTPDLNASGDVVYRVIQPSGREVILAAERVLHIQGLGFDGLVGYSVVRKAREAIGLGLTAEAYGAQFFGNGAVSSLVATHPKTLNDSARANLKQSITEAVGGAKKHSVLVLEEGMTVEKTSIPPDDAQFLLTRRFQAIEICKWFNLPPHKLAELDRATFSNIEHQSIEFVTDCLRPWLVTWEQELNRKVIKPLEQRQQFTEHLVDGLLRGDTPSRYAAYQVGINSGFLCADDVRERENMNPLPNGTGQVFLMPLNMVPSDTVPTAKERIEALGGLIRAGYDPAESLEAVDLPPIKHMGAPPVTVQPKDDYPGAATRGGFGNQPAAKPDDEDETPPTEPEESEPERAAQMLEALREALAGHRDEILTTIHSLPPPADPMPLFQAVADAEGRLRADVDAVKLETTAIKLDLGTVRTEFATQLELLPKADPELAATLAMEVHDAEARLQAAALAEATATKASFAAMQATGDAIQASLATTQQLRFWQENTIAMIAGTLARREMAFAKKLAKDPARAPERLHAHYQRLVEDGAKDLAQFNVGPSVRARLVRWADEASAECLMAIVDETVAELPVRWMERHGALTRALVVAALGPAEADYVTRAPADDVRDEEEPPLPPAEPVHVEKELIRDAAGRPQTMRQITTNGGAITIIEKEVIERDGQGRPQKIRETHRTESP